MTTNVGLTIEEGVANGASPYRGPSKRNIGLLGQFVRGAELKPIKVTSLEDFNVIFGGQNADFYGPGIVRSIFREAGNAKVTLYVARVTGSGAVQASGSTNLSGTGNTANAMEVKAAYKGDKDPGAWANGIKAKLYPKGSLVKDMFTFMVTTTDGITETYNYATLAEVQSAVNKVSKYVSVTFGAELAVAYTDLTGTVVATTTSKEIVGTSTAFATTLQAGDVLVDANNVVIGTVAEVTDATHLTLVNNAMVAVNGAAIKKRKDTPFEVTLAGGANGSVVESDFYPVHSASSPKGLACFDGFDIQILATTEFHSLTMAKQLNAYLEEWGNPIGVINLPLNADEGTAELYAMELQTNGRSFLAGAYMGWCKVADEKGTLQLLPVIGAVLGAAYIRTPYLQGDFIHIPPGGYDSLFNSVVEMLPARLSQSTINKCVQQFSCNIIQYVENTGYYVGSSRTYSTNDLYCSVHIRLQTSYYVRALQQSMHFLEQKPNTPELKNMALKELYRYFKNEYDNGALERSVPFDTAYQGICDQSNNPIGQDRKLINIDVMWIPTECVESVRISLKRNDSILNVTEA